MPLMLMVDDVIKVSKGVIIPNSKVRTGWEENSACFALLYLKMSVPMANGDGDIICKQITISWLCYFHGRYLLLLLDAFFLANILCIP
jgi:hypothetical protein